MGEGAGCFKGRMRGRGSEEAAVTHHRVGQQRGRPAVFVSGQLLKLGWSSHRKWETEALILLAYTSKEWLPAQRETLWTKRNQLHNCKPF